MMINSTSKDDLSLNFELVSFHRTELMNDPILRKQLAQIAHEEELESDYPQPVPTVDQFNKMLSVDPFPYSDTNYVLYKEDGNILGYGLQSGNSKLSPKMGFVFVYVKPEWRKKGIAKEIVKELGKTIPDRYEKISFSIRSDEIAPKLSERVSLLKYAETIAGKTTFRARRSTSDITQFNLKEISSKAADLREKALEKGYTIQFFENKPKFEDFPFSLNEYMKFMESIDNDMPREESSWEDIEVDEKIFFHNFNNLEKLNRTKWTFVAIHEETKRPAGMTDIVMLHDTPEVVYQNDTGVHRDFRGNRLGKTVKYLMLERILSHNLTKDAKYWSTFNAGSNKYMISINDELGYKESGIWNQYEMSVEDFIAKFEN